MKILIADDDRFSLRLIETVLGGETDQIVTCTSGADALRLLQSPPAPEIAILDWMMPGMSGIDVCRQARAIPGLSAYLILLTSRDRPEDLVEGLAAGADDYLIKPVNEAELRARIAVGSRLMALQRRVNHVHGLLRGLCPECARKVGETDVNR